MMENRETKMGSLEKLTVARQMLSVVNTMDDILKIRDIAEAARIYAKSAKLGLENQNEAAEIKIRAEKKAGQLLTKMPKAEGGVQYHEKPTGCIMQPVPTFAELGNKKNTSIKMSNVSRPSH